MKQCPECKENTVVRYDDDWGKGEVCSNHKCGYVYDQTEVTEEE